MRERYKRYFEVESSLKKGFYFSSLQKGDTIKDKKSGKTQIIVSVGNKSAFIKDGSGQQIEITSLSAFEPVNVKALVKESRYFEDQPIDIKLKPNPEKAEVFYGNARKSLGTVSLETSLFSKGMVVSGKEEKAAQSILDQIKTLPEIKQFVKSGKFKIVNPEALKMITDKRIEFSVAYDDKNGIGLVTVNK
jgi:hypothetical protein